MRIPVNAEWAQWLGRASENPEVKKLETPRELRLKAPCMCAQFWADAIGAMSCDMDEEAQTLMRQYDQPFIVVKGADGVWRHEHCGQSVVEGCEMVRHISFGPLTADPWAGYESW